MRVYEKLPKRIAKLLIPTKKFSVLKMVGKTKQSFYYEDERKAFEDSMLEHRTEMAKFQFTKFF